MLIDRDKAILKCQERLYESALNNVGVECKADEVFSDIAQNRIKDWLEEVPSAESEVIRCKDCKYHIGEGCCDYWDEGRMFLDISDSDYCSKAERRTE